MKINVNRLRSKRRAKKKRVTCPKEDILYIFRVIVICRLIEHVVTNIPWKKRELETDYLLEKDYL